MAENYKILIIDDDKEFHRKIRTAFRRNFEFEGADNFQKGISKIKQWKPDLILLDLDLDGNEDFEGGVENIGKIKKMDSYVPVIIVSAVHNKIKLVLKVIRNGAATFLSKAEYVYTEWEEEFIRVITNAKSLKKARLLEQKIHRIRETSTIIHQFVTENENLIKQKQRLRKLAETDGFHLFISGETGTGKEVVARFFHQSGKRKDKPFVEVHFAEIQETVMESVLFGHKKGSYTGATEDREGLFEAANGGILFLDEIGKISTNTQRLLLRFLDSYKVRRLGEKNYKQLDVLVVTATNKNLKKEVEEGSFLEDLYFRLKKGMEIHLPPLRERKEDVFPLAAYFIGDSIEERFTDEVLQLMEQYPWKGNIRQLKSTVEKMTVEALMLDKEKVDMDCLTEELRIFTKRRYVISYTEKLPEQILSNEDVQTQQIIVNLRLIADGLKNKKGKTNIAKQINVNWNSDNVRSLIKTYWKNNRGLVEKHSIILEKYHTICK